MIVAWQLYPPTHPSPHPGFNAVLDKHAASEVAASDLTQSIKAEGLVREPGKQHFQEAELSRSSLHISRSMGFL